MLESVTLEGNGPVHENKVSFLSLSWVTQDTSSLSESAGTNR